MADAPPDPYQEGTANLRETAKWLVGGIVTVAVGVLAGSPLTNLGSLELGWRLAIALAGAGVAYVVLGFLLWKALGVIAADTISIYELAHAKGAERRAAKRIEKELDGQMPGGYATFEAWAADAEKVSLDQTAGADERYATFTAAMAKFKPRLGFEYKRDRFVQMRRLIIPLTPFVILGVGAFAWAASPPPEPKPLSDRPQAVTITLTVADAAALGPVVEASCYEPAGAGWVRLSAIAVAEYPKGRTELITAPSAKGCLPVRLTAQNGHIFVPK